MVMLSIWHHRLKIDFTNECRAREPQVMVLPKIPKWSIHSAQQLEQLHIVD